MSPKRLIAPGRRLLTTVVVMILVVVVIAGGAIGSALLFANSSRTEELARLSGIIERNAHLALQQNIDARYDDCVAGDALRAALVAQTKAAARSDPLLYKLLPSLNTPEVHALVKRSRARQLEAFAMRGRQGCASYALRVAPRSMRGSYRVPH